MKTALPTVITITIITFFSCIHHTSVSAIYDTVGKTIGINHELVANNNIVISNYGHMAAYCLLVLLLSGWQNIDLLKSTIITLVIAGGLEIIQLCLPARQGDIIDLGYDLLGIFFGHLLLFVKRKINPVIHAYRS